MNEPIMVLKEVAAYLRCNPSTVYRLVKAKRIPHWYLGSDLRFSRAIIEEWIRGQEKP